MIKCQSTTVWRSSAAFNDLVATEAEMTSPVVVKNALECGRKCEEREDCNSVFHDTGNNQCWPQRSVFMSANDTTPRTGFRYYRIASVSCPLEAGYVVHRRSGACFRPVEDPDTWLEAREKCVEQNETLAVLDPVEKLDFLINFFRTNPKVYVRNRDPFMIGASRPLDKWNTPFPSSGPDHVWLTDQTVNMEDTAPYWRNNNPDNAKNVSNILALRPAHDFKLDDVLPDSNRRRYVCERAVSDG
ncbi:hypothetical protein V1264_015810 [Littorina saxatilis]|uniref:C-type lectin domain-containing protein n=2 Tax=Littorina saxatilis TaxID=31220 RepID=A0AAN9GHF2_9CAEN